jgi:biotin synthase
VQVSTLLSIKTGACPEDCKYCSQSGHYDTGLDKEKLLEIQKVVSEALNAKEKGASRFCMGAAWRSSPREKDMPYVLEMVKQVKALGMETCMTLGMLSAEQAQQLAEAGLDYYNHNLDTSPEHYGKIITTRTYEDRLNTLGHVREAGIKVCCGGIVGMGEARDDRVGLLMQLANLPAAPGLRAHQHAGENRRYAAGECRRSRSVSNSFVPSRWRASSCRLRMCVCRPAAKP